MDEQNQSQVLNVILRRFSCRAYKTDPVPKEHLDIILEAARLAPSACNQQPWRFALALNPEIRRQIVEKGFLPGIQMTWALDAPVLVIMGMECSIVTHRLAASISGVDYPWIDLGIAGEHLVLAATELGLGTCWIGWIRPKVIRQIVGWPKSIKTSAVITVGYPTETGARSPTTTRRVAMSSIVRWL